MSSLLRLLTAASAVVSTINALPLDDREANIWNFGPTSTIPLDEVNNQLPSPSNSPKYITLGLGFQNYTCESGSWIQTVPSAGAIADLYDISKVVTSQTGDSYTRQTLQSFEICISSTFCSPSPDNGYCNTCHHISAARFLNNQVGEHFFNQLNGAQVPNFDLTAGGDFLSAKKAGSVAAPASAYHGENGLGAVPWLYLVDNGSGRSHGLKSVYRIETAGGVAPSSCNQPGSQLQVPYAAEYWFYD